MKEQPVELPGYGRVREDGGNVARSYEGIQGYGQRLPQALGEREHMGLDVSGTTMVRYPSTELMWDPRWGRQEDVITRHGIVGTDAAVVVMRAMDRAKQAEVELDEIITASGRALLRRRPGESTLRSKIRVAELWGGNDFRAWRRKWLNL